MHEDLASLGELGTSARAQLTVFQSFDLNICEGVDKPQDAAALCARIGGMPVEQSTSVLHRGGLLPGPLTGPQARWLSHELGQLGISSELVMR